MRRLPDCVSRRCAGFWPVGRRRRAQPSDSARRAKRAFLLPFFCWFAGSRSRRPARPRAAPPSGAPRAKTLGASGAAALGRRGCVRASRRGCIPPENLIGNSAPRSALQRPGTAASSPRSCLSVARLREHRLGQVRSRVSARRRRRTCCRGPCAQHLGTWALGHRRMRARSTWALGHLGTAACARAALGHLGTRAPPHARAQHLGTWALGRRRMRARSRLRLCAQVSVSAPRFFYV